MKKLDEYDIENCARCGLSHHGVDWRPLTVPMDFTDIEKGMIFQYWVSCPTNGEPILMRTIDEGDPPNRNGKR